MRKLLSITITLLAIVFTFGCEEEKVEHQEPRVDTVKKLLNYNQIKNYVIKYDKEIGISKQTDKIDQLIDNDDENYRVEEGNPTDSGIVVDYKFNKKGNQHYIEVDVLYEVVFTEHYMEFIYSRVRHREVIYDIGKVFIVLNVDYNEDGYLLKGRKIVFNEEEI